MDNYDFHQIIESYIQAYNTFDVKGMLEHMHPEVTFESIENGQVTLSLKGKENFKRQAEAALSFFTERAQKITALRITDNKAEVQIAYKAVLAIDLPNGLQAGDQLELTGKSVFTFKEGKISMLQDFS